MEGAQPSPETGHTTRLFADLPPGLGLFPTDTIQGKAASLLTIMLCVVRNVDVGQSLDVYGDAKQTRQIVCHLTTILGNAFDEFPYIIANPQGLSETDLAEFLYANCLQLHHRLRQGLLLPSWHADPYWNGHKKLWTRLCDDVAAVLDLPPAYGQVAPITADPLGDFLANIEGLRKLGTQIRRPWWASLLRLKWASLLRLKG
jgi:hypothetical protein